jgi:hypothetical protein
MESFGARALAADHLPARSPVRTSAADRSDFVRPCRFGHRGRGVGRGTRRRGRGATRGAGAGWGSLVPDSRVIHVTAQLRRHRRRTRGCSERRSSRSRRRWPRATRRWPSGGDGGSLGLSAMGGRTWRSAVVGLGLLGHTRARDRRDGDRSGGHGVEARPRRTSPGVRPGPPGPWTSNGRGCGPGRRLTPEQNVRRPR